MKGRQPFYVLELHERYGPVVRIAPSELSFSCSQSWRDIYATQFSSTECFRKAPFYDYFVTGLTSILTERNPSKHKMMRSAIAPAFSDKALAKQESLIAEVIDKFITRVGKFDRQPVDLIKWFNLVAFEVMGELAFGYRFEGLDKGDLHPWVHAVQNALRAGFVVEIASRSALLGCLVLLTNLPWLIKLHKQRRQNWQQASDIIEQ